MAVPQTLNMIRTIERETGNGWITRPKPNPDARARLFCFPYAGAGASIFYKWPAGLPGNVEICPIRLPGRETRIFDPPFTRLIPLVESAAMALLPHLDRPFAFFGHSLGALIGFELSRYLQKHYGFTPVHLFVSGRNAPQIPDNREPIHALPEEELVEKLRSFNGMAREVLECKELMQMLLPILRADFEVCETHSYEPSEPLRCPLTAFGGLQDEFLSHEGLEAWSHQTTGAFELHMFSGDHFYLNTNMAPLLNVLSVQLNHYTSDPNTRGGNYELVGKAGHNHLQGSRKP